VSIECEQPGRSRVPRSQSRTSEKQTADCARETRKLHDFPDETIVTHRQREQHERRETRATHQIPLAHHQLEPANTYRL
jgi:hypothetical protein